MSPYYCIQTLLAVPIIRSPVWSTLGSTTDNTLRHTGHQKYTQVSGEDHSGRTCSKIFLMRLLKEIVWKSSEAVYHSGWEVAGYYLAMDCLIYWCPIYYTLSGQGNRKEHVVSCGLNLQMAASSCLFPYPQNATRCQKAGLEYTSQITSCNPYQSTSHPRNTLLKSLLFLEEKSTWSIKHKKKILGTKGCISPNQLESSP